MGDLRTILACVFLVVCPARSVNAQTPCLEIRLENGVRAVLEPVPGVDAVSVIALYRTGYMHDWPGAAQTVHLIEHLRITAGTSDTEPGQIQGEINAVGAANAETLAHITYYDYALPPGALEIALKAESDRLRSLLVTAQDIEREIPRIRMELDTVLSMPGLNLGKFATMGAVQCWLHQNNTPDLTLSESPSVRSITELTERTHRPDNLTILVTGRFDPANAERLLRDTIGTIRRAGGDGGKPPDHDFEQLPAFQQGWWSLPAHAVFITMPHGHEAARAELEAVASRASFALTQRCPTNRAFSSGVTTASGQLPLFVGAIVRADQDPREVIGMVHGALDEARGTTPKQARGSAEHLARPLDPMNAEGINAVARQSAAARGMTPDAAVVLAAQMMGNRALQNLLRERIAPNTGLTDGVLQDAIRSTFARQNRRVLVISPE